MFAGLCLSCIAAAALLGGVEPSDTEADATLPEGPLFAAPTKLDQIGRIVAPVMINGRGPFRMVVDTGASRTSISPELAQVLGLEISPEKTLLLNGVTGSAYVPYVTLDRIQAGDFVVHNINAPIVRAPIMAGAHGILGVAAFKTERIVVDFARDRIEITHSRRPLDSRNTVIVRARRVAGGLMAVDGYVGRVRAKFVIDTGGERTLGNLALRNALLKRQRNPVEVVGTRIYGATMDMRTGEVTYAPPIKIGETTLTDVSMIFGDFHVFKVWGLEDRPVVLLGMDVLGVLDQLTIDYRRKELRIRTHATGFARN